MFLLALLGIVNTAFFDGDILFSYAIYGLLLIPLSYLPSKYLWGVVAFPFSDIQFLHTFLHRFSICVVMVWQGMV